MLLIGAASLALHQQQSDVGKARRNSKGERRAGRKSNRPEGRVHSNGCRRQCFFLPLDPQPFSQDLSFSQCLSHLPRYGIIFMLHIFP